VDVLVVDDSAPVRARIAAICADVPRVDRVFEARSIADALSILDQNRPRVVVLDLHLGEESGLSLLRRLQGSNLVVIVLTNDASEVHRRSCVALGAHYFFDKSTEFDALPLVLAREVARPPA